MGIVVMLACMIGGGALASTASAANCTANPSPTYVYSGGSLATLYYNARLNCTDVEAVRWYRLPPGASTYSGWYDATVSAWEVGKLGNCGANGSCSSDYPSVQEDHANYHGAFTYGVGVWLYQYSSVWYYHQCRNIAQFFWYQIKNVNNHTWGSYASYLAAPTGVCVS